MSRVSKEVIEEFKLTDEGTNQPCLQRRTFDGGAPSFRLYTFVGGQWTWVVLKPETLAELRHVLSDWGVR